MNMKRTRRPSAAFVVAMIALFVALGGTAGAVVSGAVPLAKRALVADNAKKLGGESAAQIASQASQAPGPASSIAGIVSVKTQNVGQVPDDNFMHTFRIACDSDQKVISAGVSSPNNVILAGDSYPVDASTWQMSIAHNGADPAPASVNLYALCVK